MAINSYKQFKKKVLHEYDDLFAIFFVNFLTLRLAYLIGKYKIKITPNQVTYSRMFLIAPLMVLFLFLAPLTGQGMYYILVIIFSYIFIASDWLDGQIARGTGQTSSKGAFLDSVGDRCSTILFIVVLFSIGLWLRSILIVYGSICLFILKGFHTMVITKLFYYGLAGGKDNQRVFDGSDGGLSIIDKISVKISKVVKIKRWKGTLGGAERFFLTIMLPLILILLGFILLTKILVIIYLLIFSVFFIIRTKNLFQNIK